MPNYSLVKKTLALALILFPILSVLAFALHFHSLQGFFHFTLSRPPYDAGRLFDGLTHGRGHSFVIAHVFVYLATPFLLVTVLVLGWYLLQIRQGLAMLATALGILGCLAMAGVISSWLSFAAVAHVEPACYDGARAALIELTRMQGILHANTVCSYLIFISLILLAGNLAVKRVFPPAYMALVIAGSLLFIFFMDMDNWMMIGTLLIFIGLTPVIRRLCRP